MPPPLHEELAALCAACGTTDERESRGRRGRRRVPRLAGRALLCAAAFAASDARAELPVAPVAEIDRYELVRGEIVEWCGGLALEHPAWNASAKLALREERIGAGRTDERGVELAVGRRLGRRFSLDATSRFDFALGARPAGVALELSYALDF